MYNFVMLITFIVVCFLVVGLSIACFKRDAIFTVAIGAVIGANVYNIGSFPIYVGKLVFGLDGVVYTIFLLCLLLMYIDYGKKSMKTLLYTAMFSIFFTALLAFFGSYFVNEGIKIEQIHSTLSYIYSILGTYVASIVMIKLYDRLKKLKTNKYLNIIVSLIVGNIINSAIYFGLIFTFTGNLGYDFLLTLLGSISMKIVSTGVCILLFYLYQKYWFKDTSENLGNKEEN